MPDYLPRKLDPRDCAELARLEALCFSAPWSLEQFARAFDLSIFSAYGLACEDRLAAYLACYLVEGEFEVLNIGVSPELRRAGLGTRLLGFVLQALAEAGINRGWLEVRRGNAAALALYAKFGFRQIGVRPGYYSDTGEDALVMRLGFENG